MRRMVYLGLLAAFFVFAGSINAVTKKKYDFIVGKDGDFKAAMNAASKAGGKRFVMFFPAGEYNIGPLTGNSNQMTEFSYPNVSFIGQETKKTTVYNTSKDEGISISSTLFLRGDNAYFQDLTIQNKATVGTGRHVVIKEQCNNTIYKNVRLMSGQDTYYTKGKKTYWEGGEIQGTTDFICGDGDVFFNGVLLWVLKRSALAAPSTSTSWGYVFSNCTIDGIAEGYDLARSWNNARVVFLNTTMKKLPSEGGWGNPMNSVPVVFAEYNSKKADGSKVDLSKRRTTYTSGTTTVKLNPVLSEQEAAKYTISNVLGNWDPQKSTKQIVAPKAFIEGKSVKWNDDQNALCWVLFVNGTYLANVTINSFELPTSIKAGDKITVRAANEMGGLGESSNTVLAGTNSLPVYTLSLSVSEGKGSVTPVNASYDSASTTIITAIPENGYLFDHWGGDLTGSTNPATITMNANKTISAYFVQDTRKYYTITKQAAPGGTITQSPEGSSLVEGSSVTLTAVPSKSWTFKEWSGDHTGTGATWTVSSLSSSISVAASFLPVDKLVYQVENGALKEAVLETKNAGFTGEAYVNYNAADASIELPVYTDEAGEKDIVITFANGSGATRALSLSVNGTQQVASLDFEATTDWITWQSKQVKLTLPQGTSIITLATINGQDGPNVDKIAFVQTTATITLQTRKAESVLSYNPIKKTLSIQNISSKNVKVSIFSLSGKKVLEREIDTSAEASSAQISLINLNSGAYLIRLEYDGSVKTECMNIL